jgi:hypothetical protein
VEVVPRLCAEAPIAKDSHAFGFLGQENDRWMWQVSEGERSTKDLSGGSS